MKKHFLGLLALALLGLEADAQAAPSIVPDNGDAMSPSPTTYWGTNRMVARRTSRRTARRVTRRSYYSSLPGGCAWSAPYYVCAGTRYQPVFEDGSTVYVIVE
ncbi:MAG TPA: hypothetical protein VIH99_08700 [Bdellovibrionota bacterium]